MKIKSYTFLLFLLWHCGFSQTSKSVNGVTLCDELPVPDIEVINITTKNITKTDHNGEFSIIAKEEDVLLFVSKKHFYKRVFLEKQDLKKSKINIILTQKPLELEEVVITKAPFSSKGLFNQAAADEIKIQKGVNRNRQVYDGTIENGADLNRIGKMILKFLRNKKETNQNKLMTKNLTELLINNYEEDFFIKKLQLNREEKALFIAFCEADPNSKIILENNNPLSLLDFLLTKNMEFKKLPISAKR